MPDGKMLTCGHCPERFTGRYRRIYRVIHMFSDHLPA